MDCEGSDALNVISHAARMIVKDVACRPHPSKALTPAATLRYLRYYETPKFMLERDADVLALWCPRYT